MGGEGLLECVHTKAEPMPPSRLIRKINCCLSNLPTCTGVQLVPVLGEKHPLLLLVSVVFLCLVSLLLSLLLLSPTTFTSPPTNVLV